MATPKASRSYGLSITDSSSNKGSVTTYPASSDIELGSSKIGPRVKADGNVLNVPKKFKQSVKETSDWLTGKSDTQPFRWGPIIHAFISAMAGMTLFVALYGFTLVQNGIQTPSTAVGAALYATVVAAFMAAYSVFQWGSNYSTDEQRKDPPAKLTPGGAILTWFHNNRVSSIGRILGMLLGQFVGGLIGVLLLRTAYHVSTIAVIAPSVDPFHTNDVNAYQALFVETVGTSVLLIVEYALDSSAHEFSTRAIILFIARLAMGLFAFSTSGSSLNLMFWLTVNICTGKWEPYVENSLWVYPVSAVLSLIAVVIFIVISRELGKLFKHKVSKKAVSA